jgi:NADPH-dependent 2,4-dienoyl-CoA reductase/sulfur reductase-like enzyme
MNVGVLVVGGGPAGLSAAIAAASRGADVRLIDENPAPGGQLTYRLAEDARSVGAGLLAEAAKAGVVVESNAVVWGLFAGNEAAISRGGESRRLVFERAILATGSTDRVASFEGSALPGVLTTRALQILMHRHRVLPGRRVAVIGSEGDEICRDVEMSGGEIVVRDRSDKPNEVNASGANGIEKIAIAGIEHAVDLIVLAFGKVPDPRLAIMAECAVMPGEGAGDYVPVRDETLRTTNPAIFAAGEIAGAAGIAVSIAEGRLAGIGAAASLGLSSSEDLEAEQRRFAEAVSSRVPASAAAKFVQFAGQGESL